MNDILKINIKEKSFDKRILFFNLNLSLPRKGLVALIGQSGCGKSTLLNMISGVDQDYNGSIYFENINIQKLKRNKLKDYRINNIGYVFQNFSLINDESAFDNVMLPLSCSSLLIKRIKTRRVNDAFELLHISHLKNKIVANLSGGEKQRVAIARAISNSPKILLCDEPTGALDEENAKSIFEILHKLSKNYLIIVASHDEEIKKYADKIIEFKDEKIITYSLNNDIELKNKIPPLIGENFERKNNQLPLNYAFKHAKAKMKRKKFRYLLTNMILSCAFTSLSLCFILSSSIKEKIGDAFSSLSGGNQIILSSKNNIKNPIGNVYSANKDSIINIKSSFKDDIENYGVSYFVNFESFFKDVNECYIPKSGKKIFIPSLSTRSINEYRWLTGKDNELIYPYSPSSLEDDELVLALSYAEMSNICYELQIQRNYHSLGEYIRGNDLFLALEVANTSWQYDDEQLFKIVGVCESKQTSLFHTSSLWNEVVFEKLMRLPSDDNKESYFPWEMYKIYYLKTKEDPSFFINKTIKDKSLYDFVFERANYSYCPLLCKINEPCLERRVFVFTVDKYSIDLSLLENVIRLENKLSNYYFLSSFGYASYGNNILSGFSKNAFISKEKILLEQVIDADTSFNKESENINLDIPEGVINGNYLLSFGNGFKFSTLADNIVDGRFPLRDDEIMISTSLAKRLNISSNGEYIFFTSISEENYLPDGKVEKNYVINKLRVVGLNKEDNLYIYHNGNWTISYFRDYLGVSSFNLIPEKVVFELDKSVDASSICSRFNRLYRDYNFISPKAEIEKSANETLEYANILLISFSSLTGVISLLLLIAVTMLNIYEGEEEMRLYSLIGLRKKDIGLLFIAQALFIGLIAFVLSLVESIFIDVFINKVLSNLFNTSMSFNINIIPFIVCFIIAFMLCYLSSKITTSIMLRKH